jgi:predicted small secreted protein
MIKKILLIALLIGFCFAVFGCQTVQGIGEDIRWTGEATEDALEGM